MLCNQLHIKRVCDVTHATRQGLQQSCAQFHVEFLGGASIPSLEPDPRIGRASTYCRCMNVQFFMWIFAASGPLPDPVLKPLSSCATTVSNSWLLWVGEQASVNHNCKAFLLLA